MTSPTDKDFAFSNLKTNPSHRLISLQDFPQSHKESFLSHYGLPHTDMTKGDRTLQGKDILSNISVVENGHQSNLRTKRHRSLGTSCRLLSEIPLSRMKNLAKSGNKTCLQQCLATLYNDYCAFHRLLKTQPLSHSRFYEALLQRSRRYEQNVGIPRLC